MARPNRKKKPQPKVSPPKLEPTRDIRSISLSLELAAAIDKKRGMIKFADWAKDVLTEAAYAPEELAIRDVQEYMQRHGVTVEMLLLAAKES